MATSTINKFADGTDTGWETAASYDTGVNGFNGTIYWRKIGSIVNVVAYNINLKNALSGTYVTLSLETLPVPKNVLGVTTRELGFVLLTANGSLRYYKPESMSTVTTSTNITFSISYITA